MNNKLLILLLGSLCLLPFGLRAQSKAPTMRLNVYGTYTFEDSFDSYYDVNNYYQGVLKDGFMYGGGLEFGLSPSSSLELLYLGQNTKAPSRYYLDGRAKFSNFDVNLNYILLANNRTYRLPNSIVEGFGGLMAGMAIVHVSNTERISETKTKFAWGLKAGAIIWASKRVGLKLQGQLLSITQSVGGSMYIGTGGSGAGFNSYSSLYQFTLGGGLVFDLGKNK